MGNMRTQTISTGYIKRYFSKLLLITSGALLCMLCQPVTAQEKKGIRPYELDWAGRFTDDHKPLVDFENVNGWTVKANGGSAELRLSEEQKIWGKYTCKIAYKGDADGAELSISPPESIKIPDPFTAINLWVWNDYWKWEDDSGQPIARMSILLETSNGEIHDIPFCRELDWPGWYLLHIRLNSKQREAFANGGSLKGFKISNCIRAIRDSVFLDNLSFYVEDYSTPLDYDILPRPGVDLAVGQDLGVHTGEERLPFPTREETILPENIDKDFTTKLTKEGDTYILRYQGKDGTLEYKYKPQKGDLSDVTAQWMGNSSGTIRPMDGGGIELKLNDNVDGIIQERFGGYITKEKLTEKPDKTELIDCRISGETVVSKWRVSRGAQSAVVEYVFRIWQKSLVTDIHCLGGEVGKVSFGKVSNAKNPRPIKVPFLVGRPGILQMGTAQNPLFMSSVVDHYRTGSSRLFFENKIKDDGVYSGGGTHYIPKTNGERNDCHERFFLTISPRFEEILPEIPNPASRWRSEAAKNLVCYYAVDDREADYQYWKRIARYGMNKIIMLDWETAWRDGAESFTFRTSAAPGKGGDENLKEYIQKVQALGLRFALYNNYVDYAPVNALWDEDMVTRMPTGGWQQGWFRTYSPKPAKVVNISREITSINQDKYNPTAAGPDVHTAVSPWSRVDFDERMPGAGTMIQQYYSYGQLLLEQQEIWNGPVYSECDNNYYYAGLVTGSGACEHGYDFETEPWLVDFYLRKMQPISCHWALGLGDRTDEGCDRFFARTIAFAQPGGFLGGWKQEFDHYMIRGYYMLQQLQSSYCEALIKDIRYADENGKLLEVSEAIATGAYHRSQIRMEYDNGLVVWVNGNKDYNWQIPEANLPPSGYYAQDTEGKLKVYSALNKGERADFVHSPAYDYIDGRGLWMETPWGASDGMLIILKKEDGSQEVIPYATEKFALALEKKPKSIIALDKDRNEIGQTEGEFLDGYFHVNAVQGAFSYMIKL